MHTYTDTRIHIHVPAIFLQRKQNQSSLDYFKNNACTIHAVKKHGKPFIAICCGV